MVFCKFTKGKRVWKFNCSLLKDSNYLELVNNSIDLVLKDCAVPVNNLDNIHQIADTDLHIKLNDSEFLEMLLLKIRVENIKYASNLQKGQETREQQLISDIELLENSNISNNAAELKGKRIELQGLRENKVKRAYVRSRVQWLKEGEKTSKYFCALERSNYLEKTQWGSNYQPKRNPYFDKRLLSKFIHKQRQYLVRSQF